MRSLDRLGGSQPFLNIDHAFAPYMHRKSLPIVTDGKSRIRCAEANLAMGETDGEMGGGYRARCFVSAL